MTEQKPVAWSYSWAFGEVLTRHDPTERHDYGLLRDVRPLYEHPAPPTEQKPVAWLWESRMSSDDWQLYACSVKNEPRAMSGRRNIRQVYEHPAPAQPATDPAVEARRRAMDDCHARDEKMCECTGATGCMSYTPPAQPATDPAAEAARRKALKFLLHEMAMSEGSPDTARMELDFGVLRDLVGQPRKDPLSGKREPDLKVSATTRETRVNTAGLAGARSYIDRTQNVPIWPTHVAESQVPEKGPEKGPEQPTPARLSVPMLASIIANRLEGVPAWSTLTVANVAQGVHEAVYGKDGK